LDFRIVFAIAIISVLFTIGYSLEAFADHDIRGKSAYFFDCSGRGGGETLHEADTRKFVEGNNGAWHQCAYNWINNGDDGQGNTKRGCRTNVTYSGVHYNKGHFGKNAKVNHNCGDVEGGRTPTVDGVPYGWEKVLWQFDSGYKGSPGLPLPEQSNNGKLIVRGYSWGGGLAAIMAAEWRCGQDHRSVFCDRIPGWVYSMYDNDPPMRIEKAALPSFFDTTFDFVWLIDPVGPNGERRTLTKTVGFHQVQECCNWDRTFGSNVKKVLMYMQNTDSHSAGFVRTPTDHDSDYGFKKSPRIEQWYVGDEHHMLFHTKGLKFDDKVCESEEEKKDCHGKIVEDKNKSIFDKGMAIMQVMNNKPRLEGVPEVIYIDPGESFGVEAIDSISPWESFGEVKLKFRLSPNTPDELDPIPGSQKTNPNYWSEWEIIEDSYYAKQIDVAIPQILLSTILFRLDDNNEMQRKAWDGNSWSDWVQVGGDHTAKKFFVSSHIVESTVPGQAPETIYDVWAIDTDGAVQHKWYTTGWESLSFGDFATEVVAIGHQDVNENTRYDVFAIDTNGVVQHKWRTGSDWSSGWDSISPHNFAKKIFVARFDADPLLYNPLEHDRGAFAVWVIGTNDEVSHKEWDGYRWSGWKSLGVSAKDIFVIKDQYQRNLVFIIDSNDRVLYKPGIHSDWQYLSEPGFAKEIFVTKGSLNYLQGYMPEIFVIGNDGAVHHKKPKTDVLNFFEWTEWEPLSEPGFAKEILVTSPRFVPENKKNTEMWVIGMDNAIYHSKWMPNSNYIKSTAEFYDPSWKPGIYYLELIVEDNGWPCDYCTGVNQDAAKGALGKYDIKKIQLIVRGDGGGDDDDIPEDPLGPLDPLDPDDPRNMRIPSWTKFIAEQWSKGSIGDAEFANAIKFLVNSNVIVIPNIPEAGQTEKDDIPEWIKFNAAQWSKGFISDSEFVSGIKWIIENGIIQLN